MFDYFFKILKDDSDWISYYDEPIRKIKYKYEDGLNLVTCLSETIIEAPLLHVLALFGEVDLFKDWFPNVTECKIVHKVTNYRGMYACQQSMPWGMWPRDMIFSGTGMLDR